MLFAVLRCRTGGMARKATIEHFAAVALGREALNTDRIRLRPWGLTPLIGGDP